jgi:glutamyl-Q tRNA(Asp) synthetase
VLKRKDGLFAYQLAVVVDDAEQGMTDVVRGVRRQLFDALTALDQAPPAELAQGTPHEQLAWGIAHWSTARLATAPTRPAPQEV